MSKTRFTLVLPLLLGAVALVGGCSRQDTECLSSIGRKVLERAGSATAESRQRFDLLKMARGGESLYEKVTLRLRWEKILADAPIEIVVVGKEIELKGSVKSAEQRTRAVELAESTAGVERVLVSLSVAQE